MKKLVLIMTLAAALLLSLAGCAAVRPAATEAPVAVTEAPAADIAEVQIETPAPVAAPSRQNGERFEGVIMLEGTEEKVQYEHAVNKTVGFEMDYEYESLARYSEAGRERFVSLWDDPNNPENYLEVSYDSGNAELVASAISAALSSDYEVVGEELSLERAGSCIRLDASTEKGTGSVARQMQAVYVIPAADGCRIATAHYSLEAAEGFGRRFAYMVNTLNVLAREPVSTLTDEQALAAIVNYCTASNPALEDIVNAGEYDTYWEIVSSDAQQVVVLYRSYTGAQVRYYIDRATGDAYITEFVPGITPAEERSDESLNVWAYVR